MTSYPTGHGVAFEAQVCTPTTVVTVQHEAWEDKDNGIPVVLRLCTNGFMDDTTFVVRMTRADALKIAQALDKAARLTAKREAQ